MLFRSESLQPHEEPEPGNHVGLLGVLCDSHRVGPAKFEHIACLEGKSSVAFQSNGLYIGLCGQCVCVCVWAGMPNELHVHVCVCMCVCACLISGKNGNHLCLFVPPRLTQTMSTVIMSECVGRPVCVCVCVASVCAEPTSSAAGRFPPEPTKELYRPTAAVAECRRDPAEPLLHNTEKTSW